MESVWLKQDAAARLHAMAKPRAPRERGITQWVGLGAKRRVGGCIQRQVWSQRTALIRDDLAVGSYNSASC